MSDPTRRFSDNERRLLTLIARGGAQSKREISRQGRMAWATVVKLVRRLESERFLKPAGVDAKPRTQGPDSLLYDLADDYPLAIGIDVEYHQTRASIVDLRGTTRFSIELPTPAVGSAQDLVRHCVATRKALLSAAAKQGSASLLPAVIGMGVAIPLFLVPEHGNLFSVVRERLSAQVPGPVEVDDVARVYTLAKQHELVSTASFAVVTIRSGIGLGVAINGHLLRGDGNFAGLLGHLVVRPGEGEPCPRCGRVGCVEQIVNEARLADAASGDRESVRAVEKQADALARAVSAVILILNIERIHIAGHFGSLDNHFVELVRRRLGDYVPPFVPWSVDAELLADDRYPVGAAFLVLGRYCNYEVE